VVCIDEIEVSDIGGIEVSSVAIPPIPGVGSKLLSRRNSGSCPYENRTILYEFLLCESN